MTELNWDDPNYVEESTKYSQSTYGKYGDEKNKHDDYSRGHRYGYGGYDSNRRDNREHDDRDKRSAKRDYAFSESMDISENMVGRIIGRGGSNITRIQNDFNVRVELSKSELTVKISGDSESSVRDARSHLEKQTSHEDRERDAGYGYGRADRDSNRSGGYGRSDRDQGGGYGFGRSQRDHDGNGGKRGRSSYEFASTPAATKTPLNGDLTGTIDWDALNAASVS